MLAAHSHALRRTGLRGRSCYSANYADSVQDSRLPRRRTFLGSAVTSLSEGLLDLSLALPLPPSFPPYASTIILATVATRLVFTVPFAIWAKKREWKMLEIVRPKLREMRPKITETAIQEAREAKLVGSREDLNKALNMRVAKLLKQEQKKLVAEHNVSPIKTMAVPVLSQLPLFVLSTAVVYRMCQVPTPLDSESFLSLTSLSHVDPTGSIPIALGMLTFINVDSSSWFASAEKLQRDEIAQEKRMEQRQQGNVVALDSGRFKGFLRLTSVGRIVMGMIVPGGVVLYWLTSAAFGLVQTWLIDFWEYRRRLSRSSPPSPPTLAPKPVPALPTRPSPARPGRISKKN